MSDDIATDALIRWREHPEKMVSELFRVEPDAWQEEGLVKFPRSPRMCMKACTGPGKAQPVDLQVDTPSGRCRWGSLRVGDLVFAEDGSPTKVVAVHHRGVRQVYRVIFDDGCSTEVCGEHLWKVRGRTERRHFNFRNSPEWTPDRERRAIAQGWPVTRPDGYVILSTDQIAARNDSGDGKTRRQFEIPRQGVVEYPEADLPIEPYVLGAWLGDGGRRSGRGSWRDPEIDQQIHLLGYKTRRTDDGTAINVHGITQALRSLGLFDLGSHDRSVPAMYRYASAAQRSALVAGLMDTDGSIGDDGSMSFDVTSEALVNDMAWLVRSLGGVARRRKTKATFYRDLETHEPIQCRPCYRLTVTLPFNPFHVTHKVDRWHVPQERYLTRHIDRIEPADEAEVMCIEVANPSHCYLTNDFIVTHNTTFLAWVGWNFLLTRPDSIVGVTSISGDNLKANLWTELARWYSESELLRSLFVMTKTLIYARESPDTWQMQARTWAKDADPAQIGNALRGLHSKYVMWLLDESGDYPDAIMPICEAIFSGNPIEAHIIQAGNPIKLGGPLYQATMNPDVWELINITADPDDPKRTPRVSVEHAREQIRLYGRENPWVRVNIFGQFPQASFNTLLGPDDIKAAQARSYGELEIRQFARTLGFDAALLGDDVNVIFPVQGLVAFNPIRLRNVEPHLVSGAIATKWRDWDADACFADNTGGYGAAAISHLKLAGFAPIPVGFAERANDERFFNKRAEIYWLGAEFIKNGGQLPPPHVHGMVEFTAAMTKTTYTAKGDKLIIEPKPLIKSRLGYSPDDADAFCLNFSHPVSPKSRSAGRPRIAVEWDMQRAMSETSQSNRGIAVDFDPYRE